MVISGISGLFLGIVFGIFVGILVSADLRNERLESCMKLNMTLVDCATVNGWGK